MTDNEIIKALDEIAHNENLKQYSGIPDVAAFALDLIKRQQDENDRYKEQCSKCGEKTAKTIINLQDLLAERKAEITELEAEIDKQYEQAKADILGNMSDGGTSCHWCIEQHRAEAIKEFAERLKKSAFECDVSFGYGREHFTEAVTVVEIDNLVKEMTEYKQ